MNRADQLEAIRSSGIPLVQRAVLRAIDDIAGAGAVCWPSLEHVAECAGCSKSTASSAIQWLAGKRPDGTTGPEYITITKRGRVNEYTINHAVMHPNNQTGSRSGCEPRPDREPVRSGRATRPGAGLVPDREPVLTRPGAGTHQTGSRSTTAHEPPMNRPLNREEGAIPLARVLYGLAPDQSAIIAPVWEQWREANDERGTPLGALQEAAQATRLREEVRAHGAASAARAILTTIEKGWKGIVWPSEVNNGRTTAEDRRAAKAATEYPEDIQIRIIHPARRGGDG